MHLTIAMINDQIWIWKLRSPICKTIQKVTNGKHVTMIVTTTNTVRKVVSKQAYSKLVD